MITDLCELIFAMKWRAGRFCVFPAAKLYGTEKGGDAFMRFRVIYGVERVYGICGGVFYDEFNTLSERRRLIYYV